MDENVTAFEVVNDLVKIHEERIEEYRQLLHEPDISLDVKTIFERIIEESLNFSRQLQEKIPSPAGSQGTIYKLWQSEKAPVADSNKKMILATCAADELVTNNTYSIAISMITDEKIRKMLEEHQQGLKNLHAHIRQFYHAQ